MLSGYGQAARTGQRPSQLVRACKVSRAVHRSCHVQELLSMEAAAAHGARHSAPAHWSPSLQGSQCRRRYQA